MFGASEDDVPWQRVINAQVRVRQKGVIPPDKQQRLLEAKVSNSCQGKVRPWAIRWEIDEPEEDLNTRNCFLMTELK